MACTNPPELDDCELLAYIDDESYAEVEAHLGSCTHCREHARRLALLQGRLTARLFRSTCPSPLELGEYNLGVLSQDQRAIVTRHLETCPHCRREVAQLKGYLGELEKDLAFSPVEHIRVLVAQWVGGWPREHSQAPLLAPAYAGLRGEELGPGIYEAAGAQIAIDVQDDANHQDRKALVVLITGVDASNWSGRLIQAGRRVAEQPVDELGNLFFSDLAPAIYELVLIGPQVEVHVPDLDLGVG